MKTLKRHCERPLGRWQSTVSLTQIFAQTHGLFCHVSVGSFLQNLVRISIVCAAFLSIPNSSERA